VRYSERNTLTHCHGSLGQTNALGFHSLVVNANLRVRMIPVYLDNPRATRIKIKIEPSFIQCSRATLACPKTFDHRGLENRLIACARMTGDLDRFHRCETEQRHAISESKSGAMKEQKPRFRQL